MPAGGGRGGEGRERGFTDAWAQELSTDRNRRPHIISLLIAKYHSSSRFKFSARYARSRPIRKILLVAVWHSILCFELLTYLHEPGLTTSFDTYQ